MDTFVGQFPISLSGFYRQSSSLYRTLSSTHRGLTVLEDVPLLAVVRAAEGAALVELDEHRVGGVAGAVDVDAILVVRVAWQGK